MAVGAGHGGVVQNIKGAAADWIGIILLIDVDMDIIICECTGLNGQIPHDRIIQIVGKNASGRSCRPGPGKGAACHRKSGDHGRAAQLKINTRVAGVSECAIGNAPG